MTFGEHFKIILNSLIILYIIWNLTSIKKRLEYLEKKDSTTAAKED